MNTVRTNPVETGADEVVVYVPATVRLGDVLVLANMPDRANRAALGWLRLDSAEHDVAGYVRVASDADANAVFHFALAAPPYVNDLDQVPVFLIIRDLPRAHHFDERNVEISLPKLGES